MALTETVNLPIVGTYKETTNRNLGMRFKFLKAGDLSIYWYDDIIELFVYKDKYFTCYTYQGNPWERHSIQFRHMAVNLKINANPSLTMSQKIIRADSVRVFGHISNHKNTPFIIKECIENGEITRSIMEKTRTLPSKK